MTITEIRFNDSWDEYRICYMLSFIYSVIWGQSGTCIVELVSRHCYSVSFPLLSSTLPHSGTSVKSWCASSFLSDATLKLAYPTKTSPATFLLGAVLLLQFTYIPSSLGYRKEICLGFEVMIL